MRNQLHRMRALATSDAGMQISVQRAFTYVEAPTMRFDPYFQHVPELLPLREGTGNALKLKLRSRGTLGKSDSTLSTVLTVIGPPPNANSMGHTLRGSPLYPYQSLKAVIP